MRGTSSVSSRTRNSFRGSPLFSGKGTACACRSTLFRRGFSSQCGGVQGYGSFVCRLRRTATLSSSRGGLLLTRSHFLHTVRCFALIGQCKNMPLVSRPRRCSPGGLRTLVIPHGGRIRVCSFVMGRYRRTTRSLPRAERTRTGCETGECITLSLYSQTTLCTNSVTHCKAIRRRKLMNVPTSRTSHFFRASCRTSGTVVASNGCTLCGGGPSGGTRGFYSVFLGNGNSGKRCVFRGRCGITKNGNRS